jgi:RNA-directed DNA polymerase
MATPSRRTVLRHKILVICCRPGKAETAMAQMRTLMTRIGLEVNETKTRIAWLPGDEFTFLGYTIGRFYGKDGRSFVGTRPSKKAVKSLLRRIHDRTTPQWYPDNPSNTVVVISRLLRGWCGYFDQGPVMKTYDFIRLYVERRLRHWLMRRTGGRGRGFEQYSQDYLHDTLGLFRMAFALGRSSRFRGKRSGHAISHPAKTRHGVDCRF